MRAGSPATRGMLVGESDSYAGAIGRPDRDDRIVAKAITRVGQFGCRERS